VVDLSFFFDFVDGRRQVLFQDSTGISLDRRATLTWVSLRAAARSSTHNASLAMVLSWISQWWRIDVSSGVCFGGAGISGGRWLRWLQETLDIDLYFSVSYGFICIVFRIIILFQFVC
jgi:hypothetical protein